MKLLTDTDLAALVEIGKLCETSYVLYEEQRKQLQQFNLLSRLPAEDFNQLLHKIDRFCDQHKQ